MSHSVAVTTVRPRKPANYWRDVAVSIRLKTLTDALEHVRYARIRSLLGPFDESPTEAELVIQRLIDAGPDLTAKYSRAAVAKIRRSSLTEALQAVENGRTPESPIDEENLTAAKLTIQKLIERGF